MKKIHKFFYIIVCIALLLVGSGCGSKSGTDFRSQLWDEAVKAVPAMTKLTILSSQKTACGTCYHFTGVDEQHQYEGIALHDSEQFLVFDLAEVDPSVDFSVYVVSGELEQKGTSTPAFFCCSGLVFNDEIEKIQAFLTNNTVYEVQIGASNSYCFFLGELTGIDHIEGIGQDGTILTQYPNKEGA